MITLKWNYKDKAAERIFGAKLAYSDIAYTVNSLNETQKDNLKTSDIMEK